MPFTATWMDGPRDYHTEQSTSDKKEKYHIHPLYVEFKKK